MNALSQLISESKVQEDGVRETGPHTSFRQRLMQPARLQE
jgi:hypothetical protein